METLGPFKGICRVTLGFYWGYIGLMEKTIETNMLGYIGCRV